MPAEEQVCVLFAGVKGFIDKLNTKEIKDFEKLYLAFLHSKYQNVLDTIRVEGQITDKTHSDLAAALDEFIPTCGLSFS